MNLKKLLCVGLLLVSCQAVGDGFEGARRINDLGKRTFGLGFAIDDTDVQKAKDILNSKGKEISKDDYNQLLDLSMVLRMARQNRKAQLKEIEVLIRQKMHELGMQ